MKPALRLTNPHSATTHYEPVADERAAVAYLDLGTGGYMDVGTDLTDEQLAALPKGRHMLAIIGTHGVDGYNPASAPVAGEAVTDEMIQAGAKAAREYFDQTGGNDPAVIYRAMRAAAPAARQASDTVGLLRKAAEALAGYRREMSLLRAEDTQPCDAERAIIAALKTQADKDGCTCPSGDGSLRHPCPAHPQTNEGRA